MFNEVEKEIHGNIPRYLETLMDLVRIPSISFDNFDQKFVIQSAEAVKSLMERDPVPELAEPKWERD